MSLKKYKTGALQAGTGGLEDPPLKGSKSKHENDNEMMVFQKHLKKKKYNKIFDLLDSLSILLARRPHGRSHPPFWGGGFYHAKKSGNISNGGEHSLENLFIAIFFKSKFVAEFF